MGPPVAPAYRRFSVAWGASGINDEANTPASIFEAGSVSKQFTAAALLLLVKDGRIGLDDPVQKYIPELPDYGAPLAIRHLLTHTSGLRDWGSLAGVAGMPRGGDHCAHDRDVVRRVQPYAFVRAAWVDPHLLA